MARIDAMKTAARNIKAAKAAEAAAPAEVTAAQTTELPSLVDAQAALQASLERNSAPAPAPAAPTAAPAVGMVSLKEQDEQITGKKASKPAAPAKPEPKPATAPQPTGDQRKHWARTFIVETVQAAIAAGASIDAAQHTAVLALLSRLMPPVLSDDKRAEQLEVLKRARAKWTADCAAKKAAKGKA